MSIYSKITANSYIISLGNTGARFSDPRSRYYKVLEALQDFKVTHNEWTIDNQLQFADLLNEKGIFEIKKDNTVSADKDVRLKTSFLAQIGFTDADRNITEVGKMLIKNSEQISINEFEIATDSFLYLKQFLKYQQEGFQLKPLLSLLYSCIVFDNNLPIDFVMYVWTGSRTAKELLSNIKNYKKYNNYKDTVFSSVQQSQNTIIATQNVANFFAKYNFSNQKALKEMLYTILPHGKGDGFKEKAISLFYDLHKYWENKYNWSTQQKEAYINEVLKGRYKDISSKKPAYYLEALFDTSNLTKKSDWKTIIHFFEHTPLIAAETEANFIVAYHVLYMYIKKLSVCEEYRDLNIRHLKLLDIFVFGNDAIQLDIVFWYLFKNIKQHLLKEVAITDETKYKSFLEKDQVTLGEIYHFLDVKVANIIQSISSDYPEIQKIGLKSFTNKKREERLLQLINTVFTKEHIIWIFSNLYPRKDEEVRQFIKEKYQEYEATMPALFEYLLAISFYWLTQEQIPLCYLLTPNLDANLLPKTHTAGGQADIILSYKNKDYLIEATLSDNDNQRKMEAEPVPRHLAKHILEVNVNSMALFIAGQLDPNNLVVLRNYKFSTWYDGSRSVEQMHILPLTIANIIFLLKESIPFEALDKQFMSLLNSPTNDGYKWFVNEVNPTFEYDN